LFDPIPREVPLADEAGVGTMGMRISCRRQAKKRGKQAFKPA
jgi:hypothetical protein